MLDVVLLGEVLEGCGVIGTDAHDLSARGFELRQGRVEVANLLASRVGEGLDEGVDDHRTLRGELAELDRLVAGPGEREVRRLLSDLEGGCGGREGQTGHRRGQQPGSQRTASQHGGPFPVGCTVGVHVGDALHGTGCRRCCCAGKTPGRARLFPDYLNARTMCLFMRSTCAGSSVTGPSTRYFRPAFTRSSTRATIRSGEPIM